MVQNSTSDQDMLNKFLEEHEILSKRIDDFYLSQQICAVDLQRLKKRKLYVKDQIATIISNTHPDIIA